MQHAPDLAIAHILLDSDEFGRKSFNLRSGTTEGVETSPDRRANIDRCTPNEKSEGGDQALVQCSRHDDSLVSDAFLGGGYTSGGRSTFYRRRLSA